MSIQRRLAISITLVLVLSLVVGFGLTYEHILSKVRTELHAALVVSADSVRNALDDVDGPRDPAARLARVVADFDGDRHVTAMFVAPDSTVRATSRLLVPDDPAPEWFYRIVTPPVPSTVPTLPKAFQSFGTIRLVADPHNEVAEAWSDAKLTLTIMSLFFASVLGLAFATIRAALAPLRDVCAALERVGAGDYATRLDPPIARELAPLRRGFNTMAACLEEMGRQNRTLNDRIMSVQEEERAELARDLHDDVGPFLFAVGVDAAMIRQFVATGALAQVGPRAEAIADGVKHMQRHLKHVLRRLAPEALLDLGLEGAIDNLVSFWKTRQPAVTFTIDVSDEALDPPLDALAFRVVKESLSNAIRHGRPKTIDIVVRVSDEAATIRVTDDGVGLQSAAARMGFGLTGMQERLRAANGRLSVGGRTDGHGVIVEAEFPIDRGAGDTTTQRMELLA